MKQNNAVYLRGTVSEPVLSHTINGSDIYIFKLTTRHERRKDMHIVCMCKDQWVDTIKQCSENHLSVDIFGQIRGTSQRTDKHLAFVWVIDASVALPFEDDENAVELHGNISAPPYALTEKTICVVRTAIGPDKHASVKCVGFGRIIQCLEDIGFGDEVSINGYIRNTRIPGKAGEIMEVVITYIFTERSYVNEDSQNQGRELQGSRRNGTDAEGRKFYQRSQSDWKDNDFGRRLRYSDRQDVRRQLNG